MKYMQRVTKRQTKWEKKKHAPMIEKEKSTEKELKTESTKLSGAEFKSRNEVAIFTSDTIDFKRKAIT